MSRLERLERLATLIEEAQYESLRIQEEMTQRQRSLWKQYIGESLDAVGRNTARILVTDGAIKESDDAGK